MARTPKKPIEVEALRHEAAKRKNIPTAEFESVMRDDEKSPIRMAFERRNFPSAVSKARTACEVAGHAISDHFADVSKMVDAGSRRPLPRGHTPPAYEFRCPTGHNVLYGRYIRPLEVRPLIYPERVQKPWGFPFFGDLLLSDPDGELA